MHIYTYIYTYIYIHIYICIYVYMYIMCVYIYNAMCVYIYIYHNVISLQGLTIFQSKARAFRCGVESWRVRTTRGLVGS